MKIKIKIRHMFHFPRKVNRKYKDTLFRFIFRDKKDLLELYNAVNDTEYKDPDDLEINTLENVIYLKMKNDLSFLLGASMNLYEHQSTWNPNMPLRGLFYFAELYQRHVDSHGYRLTGSGRIPLPFANYVVFYNGLEQEEESMELRLSDGFEGQKEGSVPCLECMVKVLNINSGQNRELMEKCRRLWEYAEFIQKIRQNLQKGMVLEEAVEHAITDCLEHGILTDVLRKGQMEVRNMLLEEYDEKADREYLKKEAREEGKGIEREKNFEVYEGMIRDGIVSIEQIAERIGDNKEEFLKWHQKRKKKQ